MKKFLMIFILLICFAVNAYSTAYTNVLDDFEAGVGKWTPEAWGGTISLSECTNIYHKRYSGSKSAKIIYNTRGAWSNAVIKYLFLKQTNITDYDLLVFYIRGEVTNTGRLNVAMYDDDNDTLDQNYNEDDYFVWTGDSAAHNFWVEYKIPLKPNNFEDGNSKADNPGFTNGDGVIEFNEIEEIDFYIDDPYTGTSGVFYIDDVMLVKGYTPVKSSNRVEGEENITLIDFTPAFNLNNKFNFGIDIKEKSDVSIKILNFSGNVIYSKNIYDFSGVEDFEWSGKVGGYQIEPGIYFIRIDTKGKSKNKESILLKKFYAIK